MHRAVRWFGLIVLLTVAATPLATAQPARLPDLVVTSIVVTPENPLPGDTVAVQVTIENIGREDADDAFNVRFHLSLAPDLVASTFGAPINDFQIASQRVNRGLRAGRSETITFNWEVVAVPLIRMRATVDSPIPKITESNEDNNRLEIAFFLDQSAIDEWWMDALRINEAHAITQGSSDVVVAVIDSGIDWTHPEISAQLWNNPGEVANNQNDDDGNGFSDDIHGWDFVDDNSNPGGTPRDLHGTAVAGIIAAADDCVGTTGVAPNVQIMDLRALGSNGSGSFSDINKAIQYAVDHGAHIINLSLGAPAFFFEDCDELETPTCRILNEQRDIVDFAVSQGVVVIASAGNSDAAVGVPAQFESSIAIAATTQSNDRAGYSNFGEEIHISAPGGALSLEQLTEFFNLFGSDFSSLVPQLEGLIITPYPGDGYGWFSGTSASAPFVSGVVALMLSVNPNLTPQQVRDILAETAQDLGRSGHDEEFGAGLVDAFAAVQAAQALAD